MRKRKEKDYRYIEVCMKYDVRTYDWDPRWEKEMKKNCVVGLIYDRLEI